MMITSQEVRIELQIRGLSISDWASQNGFTPELFHQVLNSKKIPFHCK
ncbi:DNA-binding protein, partial [Acinetobacter baumannii]